MSPVSHSHHNQDRTVLSRNRTNDITLIRSLRFTGNMYNFKQIQSTAYAHRDNTIIPSYKNQPFITGSGTKHNVKTEIFDFNFMEWIAAADYPFTKMNIQKKYEFSNVKTLYSMTILGFMVMLRPGQMTQFIFLVAFIPKMISEQLQNILMMYGRMKEILYKDDIRILQYHTMVSH